MCPKDALLAKYIEINYAIDSYLRIENKIRVYCTVVHDNVPKYSLSELSPDDGRSTTNHLWLSISLCYYAHTDS